MSLSFARLLTALAPGAAAFLAGGLICFSLAPFNWWPLALLAFVLLNLLLFPPQRLSDLQSKHRAKLSQSAEILRLRGQARWRMVRRVFLFGLGLFSFSVSWVYISMTRYGGASPGLALLMTSGFVIFLAALYALPFFALAKLITPAGLSSGLIRVYGISALLVIGDWLRSWLFTGFPWAYPGYALLDTPIVGLAPVIGVHGLSLWLVFMAAVIAEFVRKLYAIYLRKREEEANFNAESGLSRGDTLNPSVAFVIAIVFTLLALGGQRVNWTTAIDRDYQAALIQPNIPQEYKWDTRYDTFIEDRLMSLSEGALAESDLLVWPEAALPGFYNESGEIFVDLQSKLAPRKAALITGVLYDDRDQRLFYNGFLGLTGAGADDTLAISDNAMEEAFAKRIPENLYFKQRLVPFGEYVPLEAQLRGMIDFFNLPRSYINRGPRRVEPIALGALKVSPSVCYEVAYPDLVARLSRDANLLVTISNDAWFGRSIAAAQHYQMARMRAAEHQKPMLRATNTGLTGFIDHRGKSQASLPLFEASALTASVQPREGRTLFARTGSWPVILGLGILLTVSLVWGGFRAKPR